MKKIIFTLLIQASVLALFSQTKTDSLLLKYSYPVYTDGTSPTGAKKWATGTGFFFKAKSGRTFLISARHVLTSWSPIFRERQTGVDNVYIKIREGKEPCFLGRPLANQKMDSFAISTSTDVWAIQIDVPEPSEINFINDILDSSLRLRHTNRVKSWGYPGDPTYRLDCILGPTSRYSEGMLQGLLALREAMRNTKPFDRYSEEELYQFILELNETYNAVSFHALHGTSGSPVFGQILANDQPAKYWLVGIVSADFGIGSLMLNQKTLYDFLEQLK